MLGDRRVAYEQIFLTLTEDPSLFASYGLAACQIGVRCATTLGRDAFWILIQSLIPLFARLGADIAELWEQIQKVEAIFGVPIEPVADC